MQVFRTPQFVCKVCGYNIIGYLPNNCPFCGAMKNQFITAEFCSKNYSLIKKKVTDRVYSLESSPKLGLEHLAYSINTGNQKIWIDCPSTFNDNLEHMNKILFTHHHFLGASNLYRNYYTAFIWINENDVDNDLTRNYPFDKKFSEDFETDGLEAFHVDGHTLGFTIYLFEGNLFICDYVFLNQNKIRFNPYGPKKRTINGALKIKKLISNKNINKVCGYNYVVDFSYWYEKFEELLGYIQKD